ALACTGAALLLASLGPVAGTAAADTTFHQMRNAATNQCFKPLSVSFGAPIILVPCADNDADPLQDWQVHTAPGTNLVRLQNLGSRGMCAFVLDDPGNGTPALLDECDIQNGGGAVSNAEFSQVGTPPNSVSLRTRVGGRDYNLCLSGVGGALSVRTCNNFDGNQLWQI